MAAPPGQFIKLQCTQRDNFEMIHDNDPWHLAFTLTNHLALWIPTAFHFYPTQLIYLGKNSDLFLVLNLLVVLWNLDYNKVQKAVCGNSLEADTDPCMSWIHLRLRSDPRPCSLGSIRLSNQCTFPAQTAEHTIFKCPGIDSSTWVCDWNFATGCFWVLILVQVFVLLVYWYSVNRKWTDSHGCKLRF